MASRRDRDVGLVGGSIEARLASSKVPPLEMPHVLAPFRRPEDAPEMRSFVRQRPVHLEVGFGRAHFICDLAAQRPDLRILGWETRREWVRMAARRAEREGLDNLRVIEGDARPYLQLGRAAPAESEEGEPPEPLVGTVDAVHVLFPDPWWKRKHHKRRLFRSDFVALVHELLAPDGELHVETDLRAYADRIEVLVDEHGGWRLEATNLDEPFLASLPASHRAKKCHELGIPIFRYRYRRAERD